MLINLNLKKILANFNIRSKNNYRFYTQILKYSWNILKLNEKKSNLIIKKHNIHPCKTLLK